MSLKKGESDMNVSEMTNALFDSRSHRGGSLPAFELKKFFYQLDILSVQKSSMCLVGCKNKKQKLKVIFGEEDRTKSTFYGPIKFLKLLKMKGGTEGQMSLVKMFEINVFRNFTKKTFDNNLMTLRRFECLQRKFFA